MHMDGGNHTYTEEEAHEAHLMINATTMDQAFRKKKVKTAEQYPGAV